MERNSQDLIEASKNGDAVAFNDLLTRHIGTLHGYLRLRCGPALRDHESSMDLVQSVCREVLADLGKFEYRGEAAFRRWLFQAAEHKLQDRARYWARVKRDARSILPDPTGDTTATDLLDCYASFCTPSEAAMAREQLERIECAFDKLDPNLREVILMSRVLGLSTEEIGQKIGQTPHYTRTLLSRALARLSTLLDCGDR